eukprot:186450-Chlamydomonas_euryale.AAC.1
MEPHELQGAAWSCKQLHELHGAASGCMELHADAMVAILKESQKSSRQLFPLLLYLLVLLILPPPPRDG